MEKLRDTQNYVYSLDDSVGKGATCEVFKGVHKSIGQIRALKIFEHRLRTVALRELEALRSLNHENIVEFIGEETDTHTGRVVAVMEYCDKSLYNMLCEPENRSGLAEDEFLRFFTHIVEGMRHLREHGFLHRDIKPGNILLAQNEDGSYVYKLSDFGTAKPVLETEAFQSLVGTEEYLHPQIFKAAFIDQGMTREFDAAADLWSLGATLYHAATGKVPFRPYQGRNDRLLMFKMIAQKEHGVIAGEQTSPKGDVVWSRELPPTCNMSSWFKQTLTQLLAGLMETDSTKAIPFETFFLAAEDILSHRVMYVFSTITARHFRLYMKPDCVLKDLQTVIHQETSIIPKDQLLIYEECFLKDIIKESQRIGSYPPLGQQNPLVLIGTTGEPNGLTPDDMRLWYNRFIVGESPVFSKLEHSFLEDVKVAGLICEMIAGIQVTINLGCLTQELFEKTVRRTERWKEVLTNRFQTEVDLFRDRVKDLRHIHKAIMQSGGIQCLSSRDGITMEDLKQKANRCSAIMEDIKRAQTNDGRQLYHSGCIEGNRCQKKVARFLQLAKEKQLIMDKRRRAQRSIREHEVNLHKFDRNEMLTLLSKARDLWTTHCKKKTEEIHAHFLQWHREFCWLQARIETLQKEIRSMKISIQTYTRNFKVETDFTLLETDSLPTPNLNVLESQRQNLAENLLHKLNYVKLGQAELRNLVNESEEVHKQSMDLMNMDDLSTMTIEDD